MSPICPNDRMALSAIAALKALPTITFARASAALAVAYKDFLDPHTLNTDSLFDASKSDRLTEEEQGMLRELQGRGHIDLTQMMDP